jgi:predicted Zn-dependent protease
LLEALAVAAAGVGPPAAAARVAAERRIAAGGPTAVGLQLALGIEARKHGNVIEARRLIGAAYRADPKWPVVANTLAGLLIQDPDPDPDRALTIIDAALRDRANDAGFRSTRGQVLVRLGRWQEAVRDLEFALPRVPPNRETHQALARAYRGMNLTSLADTHERKAAELPH